MSKIIPILWALFYIGLPFVIMTAPGIDPYEAVLICVLVIIVPGLYFFREHQQKHLLVYGEPQNSRIDPDSELFRDPNRCQLCCLTFDAAGELKINLEKDGYGDCSFCPKCGRSLQIQAPTKEGVTT